MWRKWRFPIKWINKWKWRSTSVLSFIGLVWCFQEGHRDQVNYQQNCHHDLHILIVIIAIIIITINMTFICLLSSSSALVSSSPGIFFIIPCLDVYEKIDMRTQLFCVPPQEVQRHNLSSSYYDISPYHIISWFDLIILDMNQSWVIFSPDPHKGQRDCHHIISYHTTSYHHIKSYHKTIHPDADKG